MKKTKRGVPIGAYSSQPLGNLVVSPIDRLIKDIMGGNCMVRYCDDVTVLTRTKAEAHRQMRAYIEASEALGLTVKADFIVAKIARYGKKKQRKRQRGARHRNRLSRVSVLQGENATEKINKETICEKKQEYEGWRKEKGDESLLLGNVHSRQLPEFMEYAN